MARRRNQVLSKVCEAIKSSIISPSPTHNNANKKIGTVTLPYGKVDRPNFRFMIFSPSAKLVMTNIPTFATLTICVLKHLC